MLFLLAPIGAADAISREKREGTLRLLLLTRLTPTQVVMGKLAAHAIRLFYFGFMMLPFLIIPILMGGVAIQDFALSAAILFALIAAGISAGLIASAIFTSFAAALACALILAMLLAIGVSALVTNGLLLFFPHRFPSDIPLVIRIFVLGPGLLTFPVGAKELVTNYFTPSPWIFPVIEVGLLLLPFLLLIFAVRFCARKVAQHSEFAGETRRQAAFRRTFLTPIFWRDQFRRSMSRKLDRNPFIWLEYRTPWARAARWAMVLGVVAAETMLIIDLPRRNEFLGAHFMFVSILLVFLTLKCASSFQREKESGAFELLLVTPLTDKKIVGGRLAAISSYYALTVFVLAACAFFGLTWTQTYSYSEYELSEAVFLFSVCASLFSVPVCGLFFALRCKTFFRALLWTAFVAILAPLFIWSAVNDLVWMAVRSGQYPFAEFASLLNDTFRSFWWPVLFAGALYHAIISSISRRATISLFRRRDFGAN